MGKISFSAFAQDAKSYVWLVTVKMTGKGLPGGRGHDEIEVTASSDREAWKKAVEHYQNAGYKNVQVVDYELQPASP